MISRRGKIARLPRPVREKLNWRLADGEAGEKLVRWLNGLPEVKQVLAECFRGREITENNLSEWRKGGFQDWLAQHDTVAQAQELAEDAEELKSAAQGRLMDSLTTVIAVRYAALMAKWDDKVTPEFRRKLRALGTLSNQVIRLRRGELNSEALELEREWLEFRERKREFRASLAQGATPAQETQNPTTGEARTLDVEALIRAMLAEEMGGEALGPARSDARLTSSQGGLPAGESAQAGGGGRKSELIRVNPGMKKKFWSRDEIVSSFEFGVSSCGAGQVPGEKGVESNQIKANQGWKELE